MSKLKKLVALILCIAMVLQYMPVIKVNALAPSEILEVKNEIEMIQDTIYDGVYVEGIKTKNHTKRLRELEDLNTYVFENADGTNTLYLMDKNVKYVDKYGKMKDKKIELKAVYNGYAVSDNQYRLKMPTNIKEGITFTYDNSEIRLVPQNLETSIKSTIKHTENAITYKDVYGEGIDLRYTTLLDGVKEDIILNEYTKKNSFEFILYSNGKKLYKDEKGYYLSGTAEATNKIYLGNVIVYDAIGRPEEGDLKVEVIEESESYKIIVSVSDEYLSDVLTQYPVTIDPTLTITDNNSGESEIEDCPIYSDRPTINHGTDYYNRVGYANDGFGIGRTAIRFKGMANNNIYQSLTEHQILNCKFYIRDASGNTATTLNINAFVTNTNWTETNLTWEKVGMTSPVNQATSVLPSNGVCCFDLTNYIKYCKSGVLNINYGFLIKSTNETINKSFFSSEYTTSSYRPYVELTYSPIESATYYIRNMSNGNCLNKYSSTLGTIAYNNTLEQRWVISAQSNGCYTIKALSTNKYLILTSSGSVSISETSSNPTQDLYMWQIISTDTGYYRLVNKTSEGTGKALSINSVGSVSNTSYINNSDLKDEWRLDGYMQTSGSECTYEPGEWNEDPDVYGDGIIQENSNCYMYALNMKGDLEDCLIEPGEMSGNTLPKKDITASNVEAAVERDSIAENFVFEPIDKYAVCSSGTYKVALFIIPGEDYHWYRQNPDGSWSHKPGAERVTNLDSANMLILDPQVCANGYSQFVGFYSMSEN